VEFRVLVEAAPREGIADPQGTTIEEHLPALGWGNVKDVKVGKAIRLTVEADSEQAALQQVDDMCRRFLANPVLEDWKVSLG
jgi:phosphoribosylformylglycinamidine synthase